MAICNQYKNTLEDLVDISDIELPNILRPVDKRLCNIMLGSKYPSTKSEFDKNISKWLQRQQWHCKVPITGDFIKQQYHNTQIPSSKRDGKIQEQKDIERRQGVRVKPVVKEASIFKANIYYHIIQ